MNTKVFAVNAILKTKEEQSRGSKKYIVIMQDEWNNLYYLGEYMELKDALPDINSFLNTYGISLEDLEEYPSTYDMCFDTEIEIDGGVVMVRGFITYK